MGLMKWLFIRLAFMMACGAWQYSRNVRRRCRPSVAYLKGLLEREPEGFDAVFPPISLSLRDQLRKAHAGDKHLGQRAIP